MLLDAYTVRHMAEWAASLFANWQDRCVQVEQWLIGLDADDRALWLNRGWNEIFREVERKR